jgi:hypothetical protein
LSLPLLLSYVVILSAAKNPCICLSEGSEATRQLLKNKSAKTAKFPTLKKRPSENHLYHANHHNKTTKTPRRNVKNPKNPL